MPPRGKRAKLAPLEKGLEMIEGLSEAQRVMLIRAAWRAKGAALARERGWPAATGTDGAISLDAWRKRCRGDALTAAPARPPIPRPMKW